MYVPARLVRAWLAIPTAALIAMAGSGCSAGDGTDARGGGSGSQSEVPSQDADAGVRYASCLRDNGIDVDDPKKGDAVVVPSGIPQNVRDRVEKVCGKNPTGQASASKIPDEVRTDAKIEALRLKHMKCLRENGYEPPKPENGSVGIEDSPELRAAEKACAAERKALDERLKALMKQSEK
jgi:hypothetical protein